jgi:Flp pilus assembly protein TadB
MSTQYNQPRGRGFESLFRGVYSDQHLRVSDAERQAVTDRLAEHFGEGRLDQAEFDDRVGRAMSAKTRADLNGLFDDLPETGAPAAHEVARRRHRHPVLLIALFVVVALAAAHVLWWTAVPLLWVGFLVVAVLFATRGLGYSHPSHRDR